MFFKVSVINVFFWNIACNSCCINLTYTLIFVDILFSAKCIIAGAVFYKYVKLINTLPCLHKNMYFQNSLRYYRSLFRSQSYFVYTKDLIGLLSFTVVLCKSLTVFRRAPRQSARLVWICGSSTYMLHLSRQASQASNYQPTNPLHRQFLALRLSMQFIYNVMHFQYQITSARHLWFYPSNYA